MQALIYFFVAINFISISFDLLLVIIIIGVDVGYAVAIWPYAFRIFPGFVLIFIFYFFFIHFSNNHDVERVFFFCGAWNRTINLCVQYFSNGHFYSK